MASLGGMIAAPAAQALMALLTMGDQRRAQNQYTADQRRQLADALGIASRVGRETMNTYDASAGQSLNELRRLRASQGAGVRNLTRRVGNQLGQRTQDVMGEYGGAADEYRAGLGSLLQGYRDRYNTAAADIEGYGAQQRADVDRGATEDRSRFALNPLSRGSTVSASVNANIEDRRQQNQRRLGEDLTRMRVGLLSGLSGDTLAAQGQGQGQLYSNAIGGANMRAGLTGDEVNAQRDLGMFGLQNDASMGGNIANWYGTNAINRSQMANQGMNTFLNTLTGINNIPPPQNNLPFMFGQNSVQGPSAPSFWQSAGPGMLQGGMGAAGSIMGASIIATAVVCIDGESLLETPDGQVRLADIPVGAVVLNSEGEWKKVIAKHHRTYTGGWDDYIRLTIDDLPIVISLDHPIEGRPAFMWTHDVYVEWEHARPESAGDILLEDGSEYIANGYAITSLMDESCIPLLEMLEPENQLVSTT